MSVSVIFAFWDDELTFFSPCYLVWLRPSKQIRAPIYNIKVRKQRRAILIKYIPLYIVAIAIFVALVATRESLLPLPPGVMLISSSFFL